MVNSDGEGLRCGAPSALLERPGPRYLTLRTEVLNFPRLLPLSGWEVGHVVLSFLVTPDIYCLRVIESQTDNDLRCQVRLSSRNRPHSVK